MAASSTQQLSEVVLKHAKRKFAEQQKTSSTPPRSFDEFLRELSAPESSAALPIDVDTSHPISQYYISSSHNTYLTGNQLWSKASVDTYKNVLKRRCRCIEIDIWDGESPSPSSSESEAKDGKAKRLSGVVKKGITRIRSKSSTGDPEPPEQVDAPRPTNEADDNDMKKLTSMVRKGLTRLRSDSKERLRNESVDSPAGDESLAPTPWRTTGRTEPRVLHGYTATKEVSFRSVCAVIRDYAFRTSDLPLIVSLEVHCDREQQEIMVEIMTDYWKPYLLPIPADNSDELALPSLESLKNKILIKVKYVAPQEARKKKTGNAGDDSSEDEGQAESVKKGKIVESLGRLGTYTRSYHFKSLDQPEATIPTHIFALSELKLLKLQEENERGLFNHNLNYMMRAYPKGLRVRSSNLDPAPFWRQGVQLVALNWQRMNAAMMLNEAMFDGTAGWVAKPDGYRPIEGGQPRQIQRTRFDLRMEILAAQGLDQNALTTPNAYVKVELHVGGREGESTPRDAKSKGGEWKWSSGVRHSKDPDFAGEKLKFADVKDVVEPLSFIRIKVCDDDTFQRNRRMGWACFRLDRFPTGLRLLRLHGDDAKPNGGMLLVDSRLERRT